MLSERIHGEQNIVSGHVCGHRIRPMKHLHFDKDQLLAVSDIQTVTCLYHMEVPSVLSVLTLQALDRLFGTVDRRIGDFLHQRAQRTGVILLAVLHYDIINFIKIDF